ncbi:MAG: DNA polymerase III subunit gamma/tau [Opitutaceae bacterium]|nr:DNA polymerase III subunit gamma/tau [Opitutaceae bacterium]
MPPLPAPVPWPAALAGTPAVAVIERAIERGRLAHSLLLHGGDLDTLTLIAHGIADRLLSEAVWEEPPAQPEEHFAPEQHPDFFALRPVGKMRQIGADATRQLISQVQLAPRIARRKVGLIYEADRMNLAAANIFLKTLEEPPANTMLLLVTTRPYALLPTIRSRCLHFRFPTDATPLQHPDLAPWLADYRAWLGCLTTGVIDKSGVAEQILSAYGFIARFNAILASLTAEIWKAQKEKLAPGLEDDEQVAIETGIANGIRQKLFIELEHATRSFAEERLLGGDDSTRRALTAAVEKLEHDASLLRLNLNESAALEDFLLHSLRIWARR